MKQIIRSFVMLIAAAAFVGSAIASNPKCPKCKMELTSKKDKMHTVAVKIKNKTYYCCAACGAHKKKIMPKPQMSGMGTTKPAKTGGN